MMKNFLIKSLIVVFALTFSLGILTACGGEETPSHTHDYNTLKYDAQTHWYECECEEKQNAENHKGGVASCKEKATCEVCGQKYGELTECNYVNKTCSVCGNKQASEGLVYDAVTINDVEGYSVSSIGTCTDTEVVIPNDYDNKPVLSISNNAFKASNAITGIVIGNKVEVIGDYAFSQCAYLGSVVIGESVANIGESAFENCNALTNIAIPDNVTRVAFGAFDGCTALTIYCETASEPSTWDADWNYSAYPVVWDSNNNDVADDGNIYTVSEGVRYALKDNIASVVRQAINIQTAIIVENIEFKGENYSVTNISSGAFKNCNYITNIEIPSSVTTIPVGAFEGCYTFTFYCVAESKPSGWEDFWNADCPVVWDSNNNDVAQDKNIYAIIDGVRYSLKSYSVTDHIATVIKQPLSIVNANMPDEVTYKGVNYKVTKIIDEAFYNCDLLKKAVIGDNVLEVGTSAFAECDLVESIVVGYKVDIVGVHAFYNCNSLHIYSRQKIKPTNWYNGWNASNCPVSWGSGS